MLIKVEDLQEGDEIIISGNKNLKYLKVLKTPVIKDNNGCKFVTDPITKIASFNYKSNRYKSVRCSIRRDDKEYKLKSGNTCHFKDYVFETDISKHNHKLNIDLNYRDIFLVKRKKEELIKEELVKLESIFK